MMLLWVIPDIVKECSGFRFKVRVPLISNSASLIRRLESLVTQLLVYADDINILDGRKTWKLP
jgi:hypothetical protein